MKEIDKNKHVGHRKRLRESANNVGLCNMQEHQVLELLLSYVIPRKDTNPIAHDLINKFGSFAQVLQANEEDLLKVEGVGEYAASFITFIKEFFSYYKLSKLNKKVSIKNTAQAVEYCGELLSDKTEEEFYAVFLNNNGSVIHYEKISSGTVNASQVNIKKITECAFKFNSANVILCHNHPNGTNNPSQNDKISTRAMVISLHLNGVNVLDHIIIAEDTSFSFARNGLIEKYVEELNEMFVRDSLQVCAEPCEYNKE